MNPAFGGEMKTDLNDIAKRFEVLLFARAAGKTFGIKKRQQVAQMRSRYNAGTMAPATMAKWLEKAGPVHYAGPEK